MRVARAHGLEGVHESNAIHSYKGPPKHQLLCEVHLEVSVGRRDLRSAVDVQLFVAMALLWVLFFLLGAFARDLGHVHGPAADAGVVVDFALNGRGWVAQELAHQLGQTGSHLRRRLLYLLFGGSPRSVSIKYER